MHKKHFFLSNNIAEARGFSPQKQGFDGHTFKRQSCTSKYGKGAIRSCG